MRNRCTPEHSRRRPGRLSLAALALVASVASQAFAAEPRQFDFGGHIAVESGHSVVNHALPFTPEREYGWTDGRGDGVHDDGTADPLRRDNVWGTAPATFRIAGLEPGLYLLTVISGDAERDGHATQLDVSGEGPKLPQLATAKGEIAELRTTVRANRVIDVTFSSPRATWAVNSLSLAPASAPQEVQVRKQQVGSEKEPPPLHLLPFDTTAPGQKRWLTHWGLDTAWPEPNHIRRGVAYMGKGEVDVIRVSFPINQPLEDGDLPASLHEHFTKRLEMAKLAGDKPFVMLPDTEAGVHPWYKRGKDIIPERWVQLIAASQQRYGKKMETIEPFNEADYGWGQGSVDNLNDILGQMRKHRAFSGVQLGGPSTLSSGAAMPWYRPIRDRIDRATTHALGGSFSSYVNFFLNAAADGKVADNPEAHNLVEVIAGAEYGLQSAIWWGTAERSRGEFVKAVQGSQLAYAEDRPRWSAAAVYRAPTGALQAFFGCSERMGQPTTYRLVSRDRDVFFDGDGPRRDYDVTIRKHGDHLVNITWGQDVPPPIGGMYAIVNRHSGKVLGVAGAVPSNGAAVSQMDYEHATHQQFEVAPLSGAGGDQSYFVIRAAHSGRVLDMADWSHDDGGKVQQWGEGDAGAQHWYFDYAGDNWFYIRSRWSTKCMQVAGASRDSGAGIEQATLSGQPQQHWRMVPISEHPIELEPPARPAELTAAPRPRAVELQWKASEQSDVASYTVLRSTTAGGPYDIIARGVTDDRFIDSTAIEARPYFYVLRAVDHSLNQSEFSAEAAASPTGAPAVVAQYRFDGTTQDSSGHGNHATPQGASAYGVGRGGRKVLILDDDASIRLPAALGDLDELTIATWVYLQDDTQWQRIIDLGNDPTQYFFLTAASSDGKLRLVARDNGPEIVLNGPGIRHNQWVHLSVTLAGSTARLYVDGKQVASSDSWSIRPSDFRPVFNYIGKSQYPVDPTFRGRLSDLQIHNHALDASAIASLATPDSPRE